MIELRGMSWDHPRGHGAIVAATKAFHAIEPKIRLTWETRSLQAFADAPLAQLAERFDLVLIDHPLLGAAVASGCLLPLDEWLDADFLADQAANSVGPSHASYAMEGHRWALAIDAACQVAAYRPDLIEEPPQTWDEVFALAGARQGRRARVAMPLIPVDAFLSFLSLCANAGETPYADPDRVVSRAVGRHALETLLWLADLAHHESRAWNPIRCYERMCTTDEIAYVPLAFGYVNYAWQGFRPEVIRFANIPRAMDGLPRGSVLGGVGLAVSRACLHPKAAVRFARFVASGETQRWAYFMGGGQPGHRSAWLDRTTNAVSGNFFRDTLATIDHAYLRPRFPAFPAVQDRSFAIAHRFFTETRDIDATLDEFDRVYRDGIRIRASTRE